MLPGFRFLFAAIVLSMSVLVFGLGAAALLRAAHEQFSSIPSRRGPPEIHFAQPNDAAAPTLAMLRVEPPALEQKAPENVPEAAASAEPAATVAALAEPDKIAALKMEDSSPPETAKAETPVTEIQPPSEPAPVQAELPAPADETRIAAIGEAAALSEAAAPTNEAAPVVPEATHEPPSAETDIASTKIATLGGPSVAIEPAPRAIEATPDQSEVKKRRQAQRAKERRRTAQRARQAAQQQTDLFGLPAAAARSR
jgi:hypothetical protein